MWLRGRGRSTLRNAGLGTSPAAAAIAAAAGCVLPYVCSVTVWPEVLAPAYFVSHGLIMYRDIFFPHTPLLSHLTALAGALFGYSASTLRGVLALSIGATTVLVALGVRHNRLGRRLGLVLGVPLALLLTIYTDGPALFPDNWMAPLVLGACLCLESFERNGRRRDLIGGGVLLGLAILVKQTSAWMSLAALAWLLVSSGRRSLRAVTTLGAAFVAPYAAFTVGWAIAFQTWSHLRWTLLVPLQMGRAGDNLALVDLHQAPELIILFLAVPAYEAARRALPAGSRLTSPALWLLLGCAAMTFPRAGLIHVASSIGLLAVLTVRGVHIMAALVRRWARRSPGLRTLTLGTISAACLTVVLSVSTLGAGDLLVGSLGGPAYYWDDEPTRRVVALARARIRPGDSWLLYNSSRESVYAITGTRFVGNIYANPSFWDCLNKERTDERVVAELRSRPGTLVLMYEPARGQHELRATLIYRFLTDETELLERVADGVCWRRVRAPSHSPGSVAGGRRSR